MATTKGGDGSSQTWQQLALFELLPASDWLGQIGCQIAVIAHDMALPAATVMNMKDAIAEAVISVLAQNSARGCQPPIFLTINLPTAHIDLQQNEANKRTTSAPPRLCGWSFFLVERSAACMENNVLFTPYLIELYLYLEGESSAGYC